MAACGTCCCRWDDPPADEDVADIPILSTAVTLCVCVWPWWWECPFEEGALLTPLLLLPLEGVWSIKLEAPPIFRPLLPLPPLPLPLPLPPPPPPPPAEPHWVVVEEAVLVGGRGALMWCDKLPRPLTILPFGWFLFDCCCCCCWYCCWGDSEIKNVVELICVWLWIFSRNCKINTKKCWNSTRLNQNKLPKGFGFNKVYSNILLLFISDFISPSS